MTDPPIPSRHSSHPSISLPHPLSALYLPSQAAFPRLTREGIPQSESRRLLRQLRCTPAIGFVPPPLTSTFAPVGCDAAEQKIPEEEKNVIPLVRRILLTSLQYEDAPYDESIDDEILQSHSQGRQSKLSFDLGAERRPETYLFDLQEENQQQDEEEESDPRCRPESWQPLPEEMAKLPPSVALSRDEHHFLSDTTIHRYLHLCGHHIGNTVHAIVSTLEFRRRLQPALLPPIGMAKFHKTGLIYRRGADRTGRPVVYFRACLFNCSDDQNVYLQAAIYHTERALWSCPFPGGRSPWICGIVLVIDFTSVQPSNQVPFSTAERLINLYRFHYCGLIRKVYLFNPPPDFFVLWKFLIKSDPSLTKYQSVLEPMWSSNSQHVDRFLRKMMSSAVEPWLTYASSQPYVGGLLDRKDDVDNFLSQRSTQPLEIYDGEIYWKEEMRQWEKFLPLWKETFGTWTSKKRRWLLPSAPSPTLSVPHVLVPSELAPRTRKEQKRLLCIPSRRKYEESQADGTSQRARLPTIFVTAASSDLLLP